VSSSPCLPDTLLTTRSRIENAPNQQNTHGQPERMEREAEAPSRELVAAVEGVKVEKEKGRYPDPRRMEDVDMKEGYRPASAQR